jgi:hypothetical protein
LLLLVSGATKDVIRLKSNPNIGVLMTPRGRHSARWLQSTGLAWAADNDCFSGFKPDEWLRMLHELKGVKGCKFVTLPDVVGDARETLKRFYEWHPVAHWKLGYPVALVAQDGLENETIPWRLFEALFIGGSTEWKLGAVAASIIAEAKRREKWVHMGRVNSVSRIRYAQTAGCDSVDGSGYSIKPGKIWRHLPTLESKQHELPGFIA